MDKKQRALSITVAAVILVGIFGCSSAEKRAAELMEHGSFEEAETAYENILKEEPQNTDAQAGLIASRKKVIDVHLINIRKTRMSGSTTNLALLDILTLEKRWNTEPPGPAAFTQREEMDFATDSLLKELKNPKYSGFPLQREYELRRFEPLFQVSHARDFQNLRAQTETDGKSMCLIFSKKIKPDLFYVASFTKRFCNFWKVGGTFKIDEKAFNKHLFNGVTVKTQVTGFKNDPVPELMIHLNKSLRNTPWFSANGGEKLNLIISGTWASDLQRNTTQLLHQYDVQESYVESVSVMKTRAVPHTTTNMVYNSITQTTEPVTTTDIVNETYWEDEPQTRWHTVQKIYPYGGWQLTQSLKVRFEGSGNLSGRPVQLSVDDESHTTDTESDVSYPTIGLAPKKAALIPDPTEWLQVHEEQLSNQLQEKAALEWSDLFCKDIVVDSFAGSGDRVHQCLRLESAAAHPQKFIEEWHQKFLGLNTEQTNSLLKSNELLD